MKQTLKASLDDIPLLCGYLHDASFTPGGLHFDREHRELTLRLERICYEQPKEGKVLLVIPVIRFPRVQSALTLTHVQDVSQEWISKRHTDLRDLHMLLDFTRRDERTVELRSHDLKVTAKVSGASRILLQDILAPSAKPSVTDFGTGVFHAMDEIEKLRIRDETQPTDASRL